MKLVEPWLFHLSKALCAGCEESFQFMLKWCQIIFREPRRRTKSIPVFVSTGEQIGGKGTFFNGFLTKLILGEKLAGHEEGLDFLNKNFNPQLEGRLLTICEEATTADGSFQSLHSKLKTQSTGDNISINDKNIKLKNVENYNNFVILSNYKGCVKLEDNEERFVLFKTSEEPIHAKGGSVEYFNWLYKYMNKESALHFYYYIYHLDLSHVDMRVKPRSSFYNDVKEATASNQIKFAREIVQIVKDKLNPPQDNSDAMDDDLISLSGNDCEWFTLLDGYLKVRPKRNEYAIKKSDLYIVYKLWCVEEGIKNPVQMKGAFTTDLKDYMIEHKSGNSPIYLIK